MELTESQKKIIRQRDKNILVSASAGSGKTFVVIERIFNRILEDGIPIENLLMVTFTNAAASELRERLTQKLYNVLDSTPKQDKEKRQYLLSQIRRVPIANISTIHAFCLNVIKDNFYNLGVDPLIKIMDDASSKLMILDSIIETLEKEYEKKDEAFIDMLMLFKSEDNLINILNDTYKYYLTMPEKGKWLETIQEQYNIDKDSVKDLTSIDLGKSIIDNVYEKVDVICLEVKRVLEKIEGLEDFKSRKDILENIYKRIIDIKNKNTYDNIFSYVQTLDISERLPSTKVSSEELRDEIKNVKTLASKYLKEIKVLAYKDTEGILDELNSMSHIIELFIDIIKSIDEKYIAKKKEKSVIDFSDIEHLALSALEDESIAETYREKFTEIYIDEYQDTSLIQEAIISKIKRKNNVIMVGDVKQSIYGFRHAVPEIFVNKYLDFPSEDTTENCNMKILLGKNFRSSKYVIDTVNTVFSHIMKSKCGGIDYTEDEYLLCGTEGEEESYVSELNIVETNIEENIEDDPEDVIQNLTNTEKETVFVSKKILDMINCGIKVEDKITKEKRNCTFKDIVILLRSASNVTSVIEEGLKKSGIPVYADTGDGFFKTEEINLIISFLKVLNNIYEDIPLTSVLYSIIGNFTLDELTEMRNIDKNVYVVQSMYKYIEQGENKVITEKITAFLSLVENMKKFMNLYSIAETVINVIDNTGLYDAMILEENTNIKKANLDAFIEIVSNYEKKEGRSLISFLDYIDNLSKKGGTSDSPKIMGENDNVVRIMTIHKSKGLEFPIVILMNANKAYNTKDQKQDVQLDDKYGLGINIYNKEYGVTYPSVIKQAIKQKTRAKMLSEEMRLLYVAMTRAKYKLIIFGTVPNYEKFETNLRILSESQNLSLADIKTSNSYLKLLLKVCNLPNINLPLNINLFNSSKNINNIRKEKISNLDIRKESCGAKIEKIVKDANIHINEAYFNDITKKYGKEYRYAESIDVQQKYTATELKGKVRIADSETFLKDLSPKSIEVSISKTSYGTFIHKVIELLDIYNMSRENIQKSVSEALENMQNSSDIDENKVIEKIYTMLSVQMKDLLLSADKVYREYEFVIKDNLKDIPEIAIKEKTLIQGVIDMYIILKNGEQIIIDYKTDKVDNEKELLDKYKYQLYIYKKAIEVSTKNKVNNIYIYSLYLDSLIEVK